MICVHPCVMIVREIVPVMAASMTSGVDARTLLDDSVGQRASHRVGKVPARPQPAARDVVDRFGEHFSQRRRHQAFGKILDAGEIARVLATRRLAHGFARQHARNEILANARAKAVDKPGAHRCRRHTVGVPVLGAERLAHELAGVIDSERGGTRVLVDQLKVRTMSIERRGRDVHEPPAGRTHVLQ